MELCPTCRTDASGVSRRCHDCHRRCHAICGQRVATEDSLTVCKPCSRDARTSAADTETAVGRGYGKRATQHVVTIRERHEVVRWMVEQGNADAKSVRDEAIQRIPHCFQGNRRANDEKIKTWWANRAALLQNADKSTALTDSTMARGDLKALPGRGRRRSEWVNWLYGKLSEECKRFEATGVKMTHVQLRQTAERVLTSSTEKFNARSVDKDGVLIIRKLTTRWFQAFRESRSNKAAVIRPRKKPLELHNTAPSSLTEPSTPAAPMASTISRAPTPPSHTVVFVDDMEAFPYHAAVRESQGDLVSFRELIDVLVTDSDDPMRAIALRVGSTTTQRETLCAAEYAYALGYEDVGVFFTSRMQSQNGRMRPQESATLNRSPAKSVHLLQAMDDFPFICVVAESRGDVDECQLLCEVVDAEDYPVDARIGAEVLRDATEAISWSAVEYASHLGYVEIVKYLLKEKCRSMAMTAKIQLLKQTHRNQPTAK